MDETAVMEHPEGVAKPIPISKITVFERKREVNPTKVAVLADSIKQLGLLQPIIINKDYRLIAGRHRLEARKLLGEETILGYIKDYTSIDAELAEIDENLVRFELTDMERSMQYARRKEIYEHKYPQKLDNKRREELRKQWESEGKPSDRLDIPDFGSDSAQELGIKAFVDDTAEKTGRSATQIREEATLGKMLLERLDPEVRGLLAPTKAANNKTDLQRLLQEPDPDIQYEAAKMVRDSYDNEDEKELKLSDALNQLQKNHTYESTVSETGEDTLHKTLQRTVKALDTSVNNPKFKEVAETWTYEGLDDIREDFFRIKALSGRGIDVLTSLMEAKDKLGQAN